MIPSPESGATGSPAPRTYDEDWEGEFETYRPLAAEAFKRAEAGELDDDELYPTDATQARLVRERDALMRGDTRFSIPYKALGYGAKAAELLAVLREVPDEPTADRMLIERWADLIGLGGTFHFSPMPFS